MPEKIRVFKSPESQAEYYAAYETMQKRWPVLYEELYIPTKFGDTHVIASGPRAPLRWSFSIPPAAARCNGSGT